MLDLTWSMDLTELPEQITSLKTLQEIHLGNCENLTKLPDSIGNLTDLRTLDLTECMGLETLPSGLGKLKKLQTLDLDTSFDPENVSLDKVVAALGNLSSLQHLNIHNQDVDLGSALFDFEDFGQNLKSLANHNWT